MIRGAFLSIFDSTFAVFTLRGSQLVNAEIWRILTHSFLERNIFLIMLSIWCLYRAFLMFETDWGTLELIKFLLIVQLISIYIYLLVRHFLIHSNYLILSSFLVAAITLLIYLLAYEYFFFYYMDIIGLASACAGILVAIKQVSVGSFLYLFPISKQIIINILKLALFLVVYLPDSILFTTPVGRIKNGHLPILSTFISVIFVLIGLLRGIVILQIIFGIQISWTYLRFFQIHEPNEPKGDLSEHFCWYTFRKLFPSKVQPLMNIFSCAIFGLLVRLQLCKPFVRHIDIAHLDHINVLLPGLQTRDTERRRQKALRDLTERLSRVQRIETGVWPEMDDIDENTQVIQAAVPQIPLAISDQASLHVVVEVPENTKVVDEVNEQRSNEIS
ncbi:unnamed protein product [Dracunculus medinensis]|uniref:Transmembrane protein 115 n=1 Tax=Dracunculus medinensis TaxID=318479 RepID=A0A0N4U4Y9_DRAME|nr:unnamed protein product [Dracunculus medinensis]